MSSTQSQSQGHRPVTRAKNATQRPGQILVEAQQKRRSAEQMAKVRAQERLDRRITEQGIRAALKHVANIQDRQQSEDAEAGRRVLAPSLRRHETLLVVPSHTDAGTEKGDTEIDKRTEEEVAQADDNRWQATWVMGERGEEQPRKTKKKGDPMRVLIDSLRKQSRPSGKSIEVSLVTKGTPPVPATKDLHHPPPLPTQPPSPSPASLLTGAERVATAAKKPIAITSAPSPDSPLPRSPAYETGGLDKEVFETYVPGEQKGTVKHRNPWVIPDDVAIPVLQAIWDTVYKDVPWTVNANDCVFERFFECEEYCDVFKNYDDRQVWTADMLTDCKFVWAVADKVFATHLNSIVGAEDVPGLAATGVDGDHVTAVAKYPPMGALALAAAVERTLQLWADGEMMALKAAPVKKLTNKPSIKAASKLNPATGVVSNTTSKFSAENWAATTKNYFRSITKMKAGSLEEIVQLATAFMSPSKCRRQGSSYSLHSVGEDDGDVDMRA
ncbi:hypothetical protein BJY52DRAFT_1231463, partial [Lactarius psammicola]